MKNIELISIANENDEVVGTHVRGELLPKDNYTMLSCVLVFNSKGNVFLHKVAEHKTCAGLWTYSAAGHVNSGETYLEAAKRETLEEIGLRVDNFEELFTIPFSRGNTKRGFIHVFKVVSDNILTPDENEIAELKEFSVNEIKDIMQNNPEVLFPELLIALKNLLS